MHKWQCIMKQLSRSVVFVDTNPKSERIAVLKDKTSLEHEDTNVFQKSLIDRSQHRPRQIQSMCQQSLLLPMLLTN